MTSTTIEKPRRNGVDTATLFATLDAVKGQNEIAKFQFRASNTWVSGTHSRTTFSGFYGAMQEMAAQARPPSSKPTTRRSWSARTTPPRPVEYLLHAHRRLPHRRPRATSRLPAAWTSTRSARPSRATSTCSAILGLSGGPVRNGYEQIRVTFHIKGDADDETLRGLVEQSRRRSAVYDVLTNPTPVVDRRGHRLTAATAAPRGRPDHPRRPATPQRLGRILMRTIDTVVIGAGHAGLAVSRLLTDAGRDTSCSTAAGSASAGAPSAGTPCTCSRPNWMTRLPGLVLRRARPGRLHQRRPGSSRYLERYAALVRRAGAGRARPSTGSSPLPPAAATGVVTDRGDLAHRQRRGRHRPARHAARPGRPRRAGGCGLGDPVAARAGLEPLPQPGAAARGRRARRRCVGLGRADRRRAGPRRPRRRARGRPAHPDAPALPRDGRLLVAGAHRPAGPDHRRRCPTPPTPAREPSCSWSAATTPTDYARDLDLAHAAGAGRPARRPAARRRGRTAPASATTSPTTVAAADAQMHRFLDAVDAHIERVRPDPRGVAGVRPRPVDGAGEPPRSLDLRAEGIGTVLVATGYRPDHRGCGCRSLAADGRDPCSAAA